MRLMPPRMPSSSAGCCLRLDGPPTCLSTSLAAASPHHGPATAPPRPRPGLLPSCPPCLRRRPRPLPGSPPRGRPRPTVTAGITSELYQPRARAACRASSPPPWPRPLGASLRRGPLLPLLGLGPLLSRGALLILGREHSSGSGVGRMTNSRMRSRTSTGVSGASVRHLIQQVL